MTKQRDLKSELKSRQRPELERMLKESREQLRDLRFRIHSSQHKDVRELRETRQRIARILTLLHAPKKA